jgi:hypothetical protein
MTFLLIVRVKGKEFHVLEYIAVKSVERQRKFGNSSCYLLHEGLFDDLFLYPEDEREI